MCGIVGLWSPDATMEEVRGMVLAGREALIHRGPDGAGLWVDEDVPFAMGHRRLAIIDLSEAGRQPMASHDGRYVIAYNGEIYNFEEIRQQLPATSWRGHSDTEVLVEAFREWGVPKTLTRLDGMFAIALWDRERKRLWLARDRAGEKPLYYGLTVDGRLFFGSELKALFAMGIGWQPDWEALEWYLRLNYVPSPWSAVQGIRKLVPGTWVEIDVNHLREHTLPEPTRFWDPVDVAINAAARGWDGTVEEFMEEAESLLEQAIRRRMISDVPLGAFLSGGIDSSLLVALMQKGSSVPVRTYSIGFEESRYDESHHAGAVAEYLGTEHTKLVVTPRETLTILESLVDIWDEPFADPSQIPTYFLSKLTREHVTVAMSGDGGDEVAGGYRRYLYALIVSLGVGRRPVTALSPLVARAARALAPHLGRRSRYLTHRIVRLMEYLSEPLDFARFYELFFGGWLHVPVVAARTELPLESRGDVVRRLGLLPFMQVHDWLHYLPDDIFVKVDRAAMAVSLETRTPYVEPSFVELMWQTPLSWRMRGRTNKWILREIAYRNVPRRLLDRPKQGFEIPLAQWLEHDLRDWAEELLSEDALSSTGFLDPAPIRRAWDEHKRGMADRKYLIWNVLMLQAWLRRWYSRH